jgi:hypothetical protein
MTCGKTLKFPMLFEEEETTTALLELNDGRICAGFNSGAIRVWGLSGRCVQRLVRFGLCCRLMTSTFAQLVMASTSRCGTSPLVCGSTLWKLALGVHIQFFTQKCFSYKRMYTPLKVQTSRVSV